MVVSRGASYQLAIEILAAAVISCSCCRSSKSSSKILTCLFETRLRNGASRRVGLEASRTRPTAGRIGGEHDRLCRALQPGTPVAASNWRRVRNPSASRGCGAHGWSNGTESAADTTLFMTSRATRAKTTMGFGSSFRRTARSMFGIDRWPCTHDARLRAWIRPRRSHDRPSGPAPNCAGCAFWRKLRENEGVCCRHAPETRTGLKRSRTGRRRTAGSGAAKASPPLRCRSGRAAPSESIGRSRRRTEPRQPRRHADGLVGTCRKLRTPRAAPDLRTRSTRLLAGDEEHGLLRRWRLARGRDAQHRRAVRRPRPVLTKEYVAVFLAVSEPGIS